MSELGELANKDGAFDRETLLAKMPMCAGALDDAFSFLDDADMKECMDRNCRAERGPKDAGFTKFGEGTEDVKAELDKIEAGLTAPQKAGEPTNANLIMEATNLAVLDKCLDKVEDAKDTDFKKRCTKAKKGLKCQVGQRLSKRDGCDFDAAFQRSSKDELTTGKPGAHAKPEGKTEKGLDIVGGGRKGFGMLDTCPKGCDASAMKHLKSCDGAPQEALTGRGGMMTVGDMTGTKGAECADLDGMEPRQNIGERPRPGGDGKTMKLQVQKPARRQQKAPARR